MHGDGMPVETPTRSCFFLLASLFAALCAMGTACWGQQVTVRVINGKSGKPMRGQGVFANSRDARLYPDIVGNLGPWLTKTDQGPATTDKNGIVRFSVPPPEPEQLSVDVGVPSEVVPCQNRPSDFDTKEVLKSGVVAGNTCDPSGKVRAKFHPTPGEIVVFVRKLTFREKWCREMLFCW